MKYLCILLLLSIASCGRDYGNQLAYDAGRRGETYQEFLATWPPNVPPTVEELKSLRQSWAAGATKRK